MKCLKRILWFSLIILCFWISPAFAEEQYGAMNSNEKATFQIKFNNNAVTWNFKTVTFQIESVRTNSDSSPSKTDYTAQDIGMTVVTDVANLKYLGAGKFEVYPKQGGQIVFNVSVKDEIFDGGFDDDHNYLVASYTNKFTLDITQVYTDWTQAQSGLYNEQNKTQYKYYDYGRWSVEYNGSIANYNTFYDHYTYQDQQKLLETEVCTNGRCKVAIGGYTLTNWTINSEPNNPLMDVTMQYRQRSLGAWGGWTTTYSGVAANKRESTTQYGYRDANFSSSITKSTSYPTYYKAGTYDCSYWVSKTCQKTCYGTRTKYCTEDREWADCPNCCTGLNGVMCYKCYGRPVTYYCNGGQYACGEEDYSYSCDYDCSYTQSQTCNGYYAVSSWKSDVWKSVGQGAEAQTKSRQPLSRTVYRYRDYGNWTGWINCASSGCPAASSGGATETQRNIQIYVPYYRDWSSWSDTPAYEEGNRLVRTRILYRTPRNYLGY